MNNLFSFKFFRILFIITLISLVVADQFYHIRFSTYLIPVLVFLSIIGIGSSFISSGFYLEAICKGETDTKEIAITFDDGPNKEYTPQVLDILNMFGAKATFFCIGSRIEGNETIVKRINNEGHVVANHSFSHAYMFDFYTAKTVTEELKTTNQIIKNLINKEPKFFRPPYGVTNPSIAKAVKDTKLDVIGWNVRSLDTVIKEEEKILARVTKNLKGGDIVLFHDIHPRIINVLGGFLTFCQDNGFKIVGLEELIKRKAYA